MINVNFEYDPSKKTLEMKISGVVPDEKIEEVFSEIREFTKNPIEQHNIQLIANKIMEILQRPNKEIE